MVNLHIPGYVAADSIRPVTRLPGVSLRGSTVGGKVLVWACYLVVGARPSTTIIMLFGISWKPVRYRRWTGYAPPAPSAPQERRPRIANCRRRYWTGARNRGILALLNPRAPVAQLDRVSASEAEGREFKSRRARQSFQALIPVFARPSALETGQEATGSDRSGQEGTFHAQSSRATAPRKRSGARWA